MKKTLTEEPASIGLAETEGLTFSGNGKKILVSFDSSKGQCIQGKMTFNLTVEEGDVILVSFSNTGSKNGSRDLLINGETVASSSNTTATTGRYTVPSGTTEITICGSESLNFFSITILREKDSDDDDDDDTTAKRDTSAAKEISAVEYYTLGGQRVSSPSRGICVVRTIYTDGTTSASKMISGK